ncbi:MAG: phosphotransferase family protein [Stellaceae bacterium]
MEFRPEADQIQQDWTALARYLSRFGATLGSARPRQFAGGLGNLNYLIEIDGEPAVLRRPPSGPLPRGANDMAREYGILSVLWRVFPLAPRGYFFCPDDGVLGAPFQIIEHRRGIVIHDTLPPALVGDTRAAAALSRHLVDTLVELHNVDPAKVGLLSLGRPVGFLGRTIEGWARRAAALPDLIDPRALSEIVGWLRGRLPQDRPHSLIHSDFKLDNLIFDPTTLHPVGLIDWDMGTLGDPLWDLAVLLSYWAEPSDPACMHCMRQMPTAVAGFWRRHEVLAAYERLSGRVVGDFTFYRVMSVFRSAVVFLQLFDRNRREPGANRRCADFDGLGRELFDFALQIARRGCE